MFRRHNLKSLKFFAFILKIRYNYLVKFYYQIKYGTT